MKQEQETDYRAQHEISTTMVYLAIDYRSTRNTISRRLQDKYMKYGRAGKVKETVDELNMIITPGEKRNKVVIKLIINWKCSRVIGSTAG